MTQAQRALSRIKQNNICQDLGCFSEIWRKRRKEKYARFLQAPAVKNTAGSFGPHGLLNLAMEDPKLLSTPTIILLFISLCQKTETHPGTKCDSAFHAIRCASAPRDDIIEVIFETELLLPDKQRNCGFPRPEIQIGNGIIKPQAV